MSYILEPRVLKEYIDTGRLPADYWETTTAERAIRLALNLRGKDRFRQYLAEMHSKFTLVEVLDQMNNLDPAQIVAVLLPRTDKFENWRQAAEIRLMDDESHVKETIKMACLKNAADKATSADQKKIVLGLLRQIVTEEDQGSMAASIHAEVLAQVVSITTQDFDGLHEIFALTLPWHRHVVMLRQMLYKANTAGQCEILASCCTQGMHDSVHANAIDKFFQLSGLK